MTIPKEEELYDPASGYSWRPDMIVRGDEIRTEKNLYSLDGYSVEMACEILKATAEGLSNAMLHVQPRYYDGEELVMVGWRPMTDKEQIKADRLRNKIKTHNKSKKDQDKKNRQQQYERLKKEFG